MDGALTVVVKEMIESQFRAFVSESGKRIVNRTPVDSGKAKASWEIGNGANGFDNETTDPGGSVTTTRLKRESIEFTMGKSVNIASGVHYMNKLEFGWSRQAPSGMLRLTASEGQAIADNIAKKQ